MTVDLNGAKVLVTGGARGIGLALSQQLVAKGAHVVAVGRNARDLETLRRAHAAQVSIIEADLSIQADVDRLVTCVQRKHPDLDILINNAAVQHELALFTTPPGAATLSARREVALNLDGLISLTIGLLPVLAAQDAAAVVNISSALALTPKAASPVYCATKAAVRSFSTALRYQCDDAAPHVQVSEVIMALVDTQMTQGRGKGKIATTQAAEAVISGLIRGKPEIWVAQTKMLRLVNRLSPALAARILR